MRELIKEKLREKLRENEYGMDDFDFKHGDCDIFAISMHRLYNYPLYVVRGYFEDEFGEPGEYAYEDAHMVVKKGENTYLDADGEHTKENLIEGSLFMEEVETVKLVELSEEEALESFSCEDQEDEINGLMKILKSKKT